MLHLYLSFIFLLPATSLANEKLDSTKLTNNNNLAVINSTFFKTYNLSFFNIAHVEVFQNSHHYHCHTCHSLPLKLTARNPRKQARPDVGTGAPKKKRKITRYFITRKAGTEEYPYLITDEAIDHLVDWVAQQVWNRAGNAIHQTVNIDILYRPFSELWRHYRFYEDKQNFQLVSLGSVKQLIRAIKELAGIKGYGNANNWKHWIRTGNRAQALKYYKIDNYVVEVETYFYYAELIGRIHGSDLHIHPVPFYYRRPIGQSSKGMIEYMENYADFQRVVNNWLENGNFNCDLSTRTKRRQCSYMAQMSVALFLSEPTRNFRVHVTNMMQMHALKHGYNLKSFYNQHPMARGKAWPDKSETGMNYRKSTQDPGNGRERVEEYIRIIVKTWCPLFHFVQKGNTFSCIYDEREPRNTISSSANLFKIWKCFSYALAILGPNVLDTNNHLMTNTIVQCHNDF